MLKYNCFQHQERVFTIQYTELYHRKTKRQPELITLVMVGK